MYIPNFGNRDTPVLSALTPGLRFPQLSMGLVGAWCPSVQPTKNKSLLDMSGRGNHGTLTNMDVATAWQPGALAFDGTDDYVVIPSTALSGPKTVSFWAKWNATPNTVVIGGANFEYFPYIDSANVYISSVAESFDSIAHGGLTIGRVYHIAIASNGTNTSVFKDGVLLGTIANRNPTVTSIGAYGNGTFMLNGSMDDIRIYNRALSPTEISLLARRRGIAYEVTQRRFAAAAATGNRRRRYLIGCQ